MKRRLLALLLAAVMVLSLAACNSAPEETKGTEGKTEAPKTTEAPKATEADKETESEEFDPRAVTEGVTLTVAVPMATTVEDWETNTMTKIIEEELGVSLDFVVYASTDYTEKLNVMINGGDKLPDMIWGYRSDSGSKAITPYVNAWGEEGVLVDLAEYFENPDYAKYSLAAIEQSGEDFLVKAKTLDGNIWGFPSSDYSEMATTPLNMLINAAFVEKLGRKMPTTTDEYLELARAFKAAGDVNGNGKDDEVVLAGRGDNMRWFNGLMSFFEYAWGDNYLVAEDGVLHFGYTSDAWKEGLKWMRIFFEEELFDTGLLTNGSAEYKAISYAQDPRALTEVYWWSNVVGVDDKDTYEKLLQYEKPIMLSSPVKDKIEGNYREGNTFFGGVITVDCENPLAAFLVMDFMQRPDMMLSSRHGEEGVNWVFWEDLTDDMLPEGYTKDMYGLIYETTDEPLWICLDDLWQTSTPQNAYYEGVGPAHGYIHGEKYCAKLISADDEVGQLQIELLKKQTQAYADGTNYIPEDMVTAWKIKLTGDEEAAIVDAKVALSNYVTESIGAFLTGEWDIDTYWDTYLAELDKIGVNEVLDSYQKAYDRVMK